MSGFATELWNMAQPNVPAASATAAQPALSNRSMLPIGASATGIFSMRPRKLAAGVGAVDVAQDARPQRQRVDRQPVPANRGLGLGAADQVVPHVAVELGARRSDDFMQVLEAIADLVHF